MNISSNFIDYLIEKRAHISERTYVLAKKCLIDFVCTAYAGYQLNIKHFMPLMNALPAGVIPLFGSDKKMEGIYACMFNAFDAHSTELDDGNRFAMIHLGSNIIASLISLLDKSDINAKDFLDGIIIGYEAACRIAKCMQPSHKNKGFHTSGTCGTIGSAMACAIALNYEKNQMKSVLSCAASSAAGILEIQEDASSLKPFNISNASVNGYKAALFGATGLCGPKDILGGNRGFLRLFADDFDSDVLLKEEPSFEIERTYFKIHASCRHCHSPVEATLKLRHLIDLPTVSEINIYIYKNAIKGHDHKDIYGIQSAKLSISYCVTAALLFGKSDLSIFTEDCISDNRIKNLIDCCMIYENPDFSNDLINTRQAIVEIRDKNGFHKEHIVVARGEPENPLSMNDILKKYKALTNNDVRYEKLIDEILSADFDLKSLLEV